MDRAFFETVNGYLDEAEKLARGDERALLHVRFERTVVDRSMYEKLSALLKAGYVPDLKKAAERFRKNTGDFVNQWRSYKNFPKIREERLRKFGLEAQLYRYFPVEIPPQFEGCEVIDMQWSQLQAAGLTKKFDPVFVKDPDAVCGTAFYNPGLNPKTPYNIGYYNSAAKSGGGIALTLPDIPPGREIPSVQVGKCHRLGSALYRSG